MNAPNTTQPYPSLAAYLISAESAALRGRHFTIDNNAPDVPPLYPHQADALTALEARPASTILHLPTGAGKTRIAIEFIARTLRTTPDTHILWASYPTTLIRQAMVRVAEYASQLPNGMRFAWLRSDAKTCANLNLFDNLQLSFVLRGTLMSLLGDVGDRPRKSPLRRLLLSERPLVIVYDECHQLGAKRLQRAWRQLARKLPDAPPPRVLGLSATPIPRHKRRRALLRHTIFPPKPGAVVDPHYRWGMDVGHRVQNRELEALGVLCPINAWQQRSGFFDIPYELLVSIGRRTTLKEPAQNNASPEELLDFSAQFNARVMSHPEILKFLAARIAARLPQLGKTLVFLPKIKTADAFVELLEAHPATAGRVYLVHSRVGLDDTDPRQGVYPQLAAFTARGDEPCIMVNVEMLTTGFDDPKIKTIVLGRLTYSMNLFWQMIGRGSRGPRSKGTTSCNIIDPIRLTRLYPIADGYRPTITSSNDTLLGGEDVGLGRMDPTLSIIDTAPVDPTPDVVDDSWFANVTLDEHALTAWTPRAPHASALSNAKPPPQRFEPPTPLPTPTPNTAHQRLCAVLAASSSDNLERCCKALGVAPASRQTTAQTLTQAVSKGGRAALGQLFDAMLGTELRTLLGTLELTSTASKKAASVVTIIHTYIVLRPNYGLQFLFENHLPPRKLAQLHDAGPRLYATLEAHYDKRGLQAILIRLGQPRSAKNKSLLIQRLFETFLAKELSEERFEFE